METITSGWPMRCSAPVPDGGGATVVVQGMAWWLWAGVTAAGYAAWRRRRGDGLPNLLVVGGVGLVLRLSTLLIGLPRLDGPLAGGLSAALDLMGLVVLAWPFLAPPLPTGWAERAAGAGLLGVTGMCGVAFWQWVRYTLGLSPGARLVITPGHVCLMLAVVAGLNWLHHPPRRQMWAASAGAALAAGVAFPLLPLSPLSPWFSMLTAATAALAAAWLNRLERPLPSPSHPALPAAEDGGRRWDALRMIELGAALFTATEPTQMLKAVAATLLDGMDIRMLALCLVEPPGNGGAPGLRLAARWARGHAPSPGDDITFAHFLSELDTELAEMPVQGQLIGPPGSPGRIRLDTLNRTLATDLQAALILPLLPPPPQNLLPGEQEVRGALIFGWRGAPPPPPDLQICRAVADQLTIAVDHLRLRARTGRSIRAPAISPRGWEGESELLRAILESLGPVWGIMVADSQGKVRLANRAALDILGMTRAEVIGQSFQEIWGRLSPGGQAESGPAWSDLVACDPTELFRVGERVVQARVVGLEGAGMTGLLHDITPLVQIAARREGDVAMLRAQVQRLEVAAAQLQELDRFRTRFIANLSHELRTPLNAIIGFSGMMLKEMDGPLSDVQRQDLRAIHTGGKHLLSLITNILDISQIWANKMELSLGDVNVAEVIEEAIPLATPLIGEKPLTIVQELPAEPLMARADRTRVRQVVLNLLTNAIKYTEQGGVTISASRDENHVIVRVSDTGIGIAPEYFQTIFEPFGRIDNSATRKVDGLGLGLSISQRLIELHGGRLWVESEPGRGSTFYFTLPVADSQAAAAEREAARRMLEKVIAQWQ